MKKRFISFLAPAVFLLLLTFAFILLHPLQTPSVTRTATPNRTDIARFSTQGAKITPATLPPPPVISKHTDLSPELDDNQKYDVVVTRANGTTEEYKVGPAVHVWPPLPNLPDEIYAKLELKKGDIIIQWYDISEYNIALGRMHVIATYYAQRDAEAATEKAQWTPTPLIWPVIPLADLLKNLPKYNDRYVVVSGFYDGGVGWPTCLVHSGGFVLTSWSLRASPTTADPAQMILIENSKDGKLFHLFPQPVPGQAFTIRGWVRFFSGEFGCASETPGPINPPVKQIWWIEAESVEGK